MPRRDGARTETALRLWAFVALCGVLSVLLLVALLVEGNHSGPDGAPLWSSVHVFVPNLSSLLAIGSAFRHTNDEPSASASMRLVETMPVGDCELQSTLPQSFDVLLNRTDLATTSIDISAMYWNLLGADDRKTYTDAEMATFGANRGQRLFDALVRAAKRGVSLRIVTAGESIGFTATSLPQELQQLVDAAPQQVSVRMWSGAQWYGGGILHQKIWIFDQQHVYVGSANMDWKSLAQVMEMGVVLENLPSSSHVLQDFQRLFDVWWMWCTLDAHAAKATTTYESDEFQATLKVPSWSTHVPQSSRAKDPFVEAGLEAFSTKKSQLHTTLSNATANLFVASSPIESTARRTRTFDEDALVYTIQTAQRRVSLSVMDLTPYSMYSLETHTNASIWWPALTDALMAGVYGKPGLQVRLLISQWQHSRKEMFETLKLLDQQAASCRHQSCGGSLEIKIFRVPGWHNTTSTAHSKAQWPSYTRVNHAKYIVSDQRVNIGTSNMEWGYFYTTAGISVNTDHEPTRQAMEAVFDRNWNLPYAVPLRLVGY